MRNMVRPALRERRAGRTGNSRGRLLHREVAHLERVRRGGSHEQPVIIEAGHCVLFQAEGEVAADGHF